MRRARVRRDDGFTLIELIIAMAIMGLILGALGTGVFVLLRTTGVSADRLIGSHDAELLTEWLTTDVQSATATTEWDNVPTTPPGCLDDSSVPAGGVNVVHLTWIERSANRVYHSSYRVEQGGSGGYRLVRYFCQEGQPSTRFPVARALKSGAICAAHTPADGQGVCLLNDTWPKLSLWVTSTSGGHDYTYTATATARSAPLAQIVGSAPTVTDAVALNTDASGDAGVINRIVVTFDEALAPVNDAPKGSWTLHNAPSGATIQRVDIANHSAVLTMSVPLSAAPETDTVNFTIDLAADPNGVRDGLGHAASFSGLDVRDGMAPVMLGAKTADESSPPDGTIDTIIVTMSESVTVDDPGVFTVTPPAGDGEWAGVATPVTGAVANGTEIHVSIDPTATIVDTGSTGFGVTLQAHPNGVRDADGNFGSSTVAATDGIAPELLSAVSHDNDHDGQLDEVVATFSEPLPTSIDQNVWAFTKPVDSVWTRPPLTQSATISGRTVTLAISDGSAPVDTLADGLDLEVLVGSTNPFRDNAGNTLSAGLTQPVVDEMAPLLLASPVFARGATPGLAEQGDSFEAAFTEPLPPAGPTTVTMTLSRSSGSGITTLDIPGFLSSAVSVPDSYLSGGTHRASWDVETTVTGKTVTVVIVGACQGDCSSLQSGTSAAMTLPLDLADGAGNGALAVALNIQWF